MKFTPITPAAALERLRTGNRRFIGGLRAVEPMLSHLKMGELALKGQRPFAIVLTCSDSRSPAEMIFDQGLGDLFVVRVAGNVVAPSLLASIEFAASKFGSSTVLVLGHTHCGAIGATIQHALAPEKSLGSPHLEELVGRIRPAVDRVMKRPSLEQADWESHSTVENVERSMRLIREQSQIVRDLISTGRLSISGGVLDIATGAVQFLDETGAGDADHSELLALEEFSNPASIHSGTARGQGGDESNREPKRDRDATA